MSAHTFETLSAELTQALGQQTITPPRTTVRCTLGRDKVMVLVEYPLDSASAEPTAKQTLDWLEQHLRQQFDTAGLPDEAADLPGEIEAIPVQLYLKHESEVRPFTMHSFTWKVADGFTDLFGEPTTLPISSTEEMSSSELSVDELEATFAISEVPKQFNQQPDNDENDDNVEEIEETVPSTLESMPESAPQNLENSSDAISHTSSTERLPEQTLDRPLEPFLSDSPIAPDSVVMLPEGEEERVLSELESDLSLDLETDVDSLDTDLDSDLADDFDFQLAADQSDRTTTTNPLDLGLDLDEALPPASIPNASTDSDTALDDDLLLGINTTGAVIPNSTTELSLPGESPTIESSEFELPTVDLPIVVPKAGTNLSTDFFDLQNDLNQEEDKSKLENADLFELSSLEKQTLEDEISAAVSDRPQTEESQTKTTQTEYFEEKISTASTSQELTPTEVTEATEIADNASLIDLISPANTGLEQESSEIESPDIESPDIENSESEIESPDVESLETESWEVESTATGNDQTDNLIEDVADPLDAYLPEENSPTEETLPIEQKLPTAPLSTPDTFNPDHFTTDASEIITEDFDLLDNQSSTLDSNDLVPTDLEELSIEAKDIDAVELDTSETDNLETNSLETDNLKPENFATEDLEIESLEVDSPETKSLETESLEIENLETENLETESPKAQNLEIDSVATENLETSSLEVDTINQPPDSSDLEEFGDTHTASQEPDYDLYDYEIAEEETTEENYVEDEGSAYYLEDVSDEEPTADRDEEVALVDDIEVQRQREQWQQQSKRSPWLIVGTFSFVLLGVLGYVFTRPCSVGPCDRIETAKDKGAEAISSLSAASNLKEVTEAKTELEHAVQMLDPIPAWSSHYDEAQTVLPSYEQQLSALDFVTEAQAKAYSAAVKSQDPPHPASTWQEVASEWREATSLLSKVPIESPVRTLAERKLVEYRANLSTILVRIEAEAGAEVSLRQAQAAASRATQNTDQADTLAEWETILADWNTAVENLKRIPQGSQAYGEAQSILPEYEEKLLETRTKVEQEQSASQTLQKAEELSTEAKIAEKEEQWTTAVENWQQAVFYLGEVPENSIPYTEARSQLASYVGALSTAENNRQASLRFSSIEPSFYLICGASETQKCTYSITAGKVRIDLAEGYDTVINESITPPPQRTSINPSAQLVNQSNQLLQQITLLSTQAQIPVELYNSKGVFLAKYQPDLDGFVRQ